MNDSERSKKYPESVLGWFLWSVGVFTQLAFFAGVMPAKWIIEITDELGLQPFPDTPVAFYLARHLSVLYGFVGVGVLVLSYRLSELRALVRYLAMGTIVFGVLQAIVGVQSEMPIWWILMESLSTIFGGLLIGWLDRNCALVADKRE